MNLHISFILGISVYFLFLVDRFLWKKIKYKYLVLGLFLLLSILANPFGLHGVIYPLRVFQNYGYSIVENQSPFFLEKLMDNPTIFYFKISALMLLLIIPRLLAKRYFFEVLLAILTGLLSFWAIRHFPFFALSLVLPLSLGLTPMVGKISSYMKNFNTDNAWVRGRQFLARIIKDSHWSILFFDDRGIILVRKDFIPANVKVLDNIQSFRNYSVELIKQTVEPDALARLANYFSLIGYSDLETLVIIKFRSFR